MSKLNPAQVKALSAPGRYMDGHGLMLEVKPSGAKSWVVRLQSGGKRRDYGLGSFKDVGLSEARDLARDYRRGELWGKRSATSENIGRHARAAEIK